MRTERREEGVRTESKEKNVREERREEGGECRIEETEGGRRIGK